MDDVAVEVIVESSVSSVVIVGFFLVDVEAVYWVAAVIGRNVIFCEVGNIITRIDEIFLGFTPPRESKKGLQLH